MNSITYIATYLYSSSVYAAEPLMQHHLVYTANYYTCIIIRTCLHSSGIIIYAAVLYLFTQQYCLCSSVILIYIAVLYLFITLFIIASYLFYYTYGRVGWMIEEPE